MARVLTFVTLGLGLVALVFAIVATASTKQGWFISSASSPVGKISISYGTLGVCAGFRGASQCVDYSTYEGIFDSGSGSSTAGAQEARDAFAKIVTGGKVALAMSVMALVFSFVAMVLVGLRSFLGKIQSPTPAMGLFVFAALFALVGFVVFIALVKTAESDIRKASEAPSTNTNSVTSTTGQNFGSNSGAGSNSVTSSPNGGTFTGSSGSNGGSDAFVPKINPSYAWVLCLLAMVFALAAAVVVALDKQGGAEGDRPYHLSG